MVPIMGVLSAFVFAAQTLNFPVLGGTSGHLVGGALLAVLLGPGAGFLALVTVIVAQALFLQDGGLIALGANLFNIGAVTVWSGYAVFHLAGGKSDRPKRLYLAGFLAGWASLVLSAISCALQLAVSGAIPLKVGLPAMAGYHAIIGLVEGALTAGVLAFLGRVRPDLLRLRAGLQGAGDWIGAVVFVAAPYVLLILAGSSELPDPLQKLLAAAPLTGGREAEAGGLASPDRFLNFIGLAAAFVVLMAAVLAVGRAVRDKRGHS